MRNLHKMSGATELEPSENRLVTSIRIGNLIHQIESALLVLSYLSVWEDTHELAS